MTMNLVSTSNPKPVAKYTDGVERIKMGMKIPFTCTVYEKVLVTFDKADIAEKGDEED